MRVVLYLWWSEWLEQARWRWMLNAMMVCSGILLVDVMVSVPTVQRQQAVVSVLINLIIVEISQVAALRGRQAKLRTAARSQLEFVAGALLAVIAVAMFNTLSAHYVMVGCIIVMYVGWCFVYAVRAG